MKSQILYIEDSELTRMAAEINLTEHFPRYISNMIEDGCDFKEMLDEKEISLEDIAIICTDGKLGAGITGWDIVEELRFNGYKGPAIYIGGTPLPIDKKDLYSEQIEFKTGDVLVETIQKYLK